MKHATNSISVEGLGKRYRLGTIGRHTLAEELQFWTLKALGRDPAHRMGVVNDKAPATPRRRLAAQLDPDHAGLFWALRDVSFTVRPGEMLGVIGPNGAGKSTLLKILARVTEPTEGRARIVGRLSSLLEVGTGFHPELTGRENVFVNGAILGMTADEIRRKYETIVEFADMQDFIDTPVKRYSSGMRTRLAFAVAAHLEPDVLLLDEVLSVGDAAFQEKCAKKMKQIVGRGRTVLLVSHRTSTVSDLCQRVIWIDRGRIRQEGTAEAVVTDYLTASSASGGEQRWERGLTPQRLDGFTLYAMRFCNAQGNVAAAWSENHPFAVELDYELQGDRPHYRLGVSIASAQGTVIATALAPDSAAGAAQGRHTARAEFPGGWLTPGSRAVTALVATPDQPRGIRIAKPLTCEILARASDTVTGGLVHAPVQWLCDGATPAASAPGDREGYSG